MTLSDIPLLLVAALAFVQNAPSRAPRGTSSEPPLRTLILNKVTPMGMPTFGYAGSPVCDQAGNLYFEAVTPGVHQVDIGPFIHVSADGERQQVILPPGKEGGTGLLDFVFQTVSPGGTYYLLGRGHAGVFLSQYRDDGSILREMRLAVPIGVYPQAFAVANSGVTYLSGHVEPGSGAKPRKSFAGLFAGDGSLIADLSAGLKNYDLASPMPVEGLVKAGQDGLFYVLRDDEIAAFNQSGALGKSYRFQKPDDRWSAARLDVSGGLAAVRLVAPDPQANGAVYLTTRLLLIDLQTGETRGQYTFGPGVPGAVMCFSRQDGFSVYGVEKGQAVRKWYGFQ